MKEAGWELKMTDVQEWCKKKMSWVSEAMDGQINAIAASASGMCRSHAEATEDQAKMEAQISRYALYTGVTLVAMSRFTLRMKSVSKARICDWMTVAFAS